MTRNENIFISFAAFTSTSDLVFDAAYVFLMAYIYICYFWYLNYCSLMYRNWMCICVYLMYFKMGKLSYHKQHNLATYFSDIRLRLFSCIAYCTICTDAVTTSTKRTKFVWRMPMLTEFVLTCSYQALSNARFQFVFALGLFLSSEILIGFGLFKATTSFLLMTEHTRVWVASCAKIIRISARQLVETNS